MLKRHSNSSTQGVGAWAEKRDPVQSRVFLFCEDPDVALQTHLDLFIPGHRHHDAELQVLEPDTKLLFLIDSKYLRVPSEVGEVLYDLELAEPRQNAVEDTYVFIEHSILAGVEFVIAFLEHKLLYLR